MKVYHFYVKILLITSFLLGSLNKIYAWGTTGHRIVAEIAEKHLSPRAKRNLKKLIGNQKLAYWANWPDEIKSDTTDIWKHTEVWHYINISPQNDAISFSKALKEQKKPNIYTEIKNLSKKIRDQNTSPKDKEIYLRFLVHLMGDMAQPMHTGRSEDLGGNLIKIQFFGKPTNLHSLWDSKLIDATNYSYTEFARILNVKSKKEIKQIQSGSLEDWFYDSHKIANKLYADVENGKNYSYAYQYKYNPILEQQLLYGGLRLAKMLNEILG